METNKNKVVDTICYIAENKQKIDAVKCREMLENADLEQSLRLMKERSTARREALGTAVTAGIALSSSAAVAATGVSALSSAASAGAVGLGAAVGSPIVAPAVAVMAPLMLLSSFAMNCLTRKK